MMPSSLALLPKACLGRDASVLESILETETYLALWHRPVPPSVAAWIESWIETSTLALELAPAATETHRLVALGLTASGCGEGAELAWLCEDIHRLATLFSRLAGQPRINLRLETVRDAGCAKFHVDAMKLRLLCSYAGGGTEWVPAGAARLDYLGWTDGTIEEANARVVPDPESIQRMATGAVALFKGRLYPGFEGAGLVHRSAPVCCAKDHRLRLCLDFPDA